MTTHMVPPIPRYYTSSSHEGDIFDALQNGLTDDYYVLHSFRLNGDDARSIKEIDYIIYCRKRGILCLEVKSGSAITYSDGMWKYSDGNVIGRKYVRWNYYTQKNETYYVGPYQQAENACHAIRDKLEELGLDKKCNVHYAVWFCDLSAKAFAQITQSRQLGELQNINQITLLREDKQKPLAKIEKIFETAPMVQSLTTADEKCLFDRFLKPEFAIVPSTYAESIDLQNAKLQMLTFEQSRVLEFLDGQRSVVVNGTAGTGKTFVAREKAVREALRGGRVLFLCFNRFLRDHLKEDLKGVGGIDVMTLHELCVFFKVKVGDWTELYCAIDQKRGNLPWNHIVIDEGQDFSAKSSLGSSRDVEETGEILSILEKALLEEDPDDSSKSFVLFYDRYQLVQGDRSASKDWKLRIPEYIANADCKLTLYRNCRNTENVAKSFMTVVGMKPFLYQCVKAPMNDATHVYYCEKGDPWFKKIIEAYETEKGKYLSEGGNGRHNRVVVVSAGYTSLSESSLGRMGKLTFAQAGGISETGRAHIRGTDIPVYTARTFKGLESDSVILIDLLPECLSDPMSEAARLFYTAASRAKFSLKIVLDWTLAECKAAAGIVNPEITSVKKVGKLVAGKFTASCSF